MLRSLTLHTESQCEILRSSDKNRWEVFSHQFYQTTRAKGSSDAVAVVINGRLDASAKRLGPLPVAVDVTGTYIVVAPCVLEVCTTVVEQ